ncbi:MAG: D-2-hydroxyacid dehydrogenase family protein, partial [Betaproteobacteria bacterium]|nr:D-2-hydroxyacid dehydrogenase family protein [Betaproteobacteria bacterium]
MQVIVLDDYQDAVRKLPCYARFVQASPAHEVKIFNNSVKGAGQLGVRLRDAQALVLIRERTPITRALLDKLPKLQLISQTGRAGAHIDLAACTARSVAVCEGSGDPRPAAELAWALIMAAMRRLPQYIGNLKHGAWQQSGLKAAAMPANFALGQVLAGKTLGIWGYGNIGRLVAQFGRAFAMNVLVWGSDASRALAQEHGHQAADSRAALFAASDVLSLHLRLSEATQGVVTLDDLSLMKPHALFVNVSRAELLAPDALVSALNRGRPGMAAVDVFESEPPLQGHPLLRLENAICTPHIGFVELGNYERMFAQAFDNVAAFA